MTTKNQDFFPSYKKGIIEQRRRCLEKHEPYLRHREREDEHSKKLNERYDSLLNEIDRHFDKCSRHKTDQEKLKLNEDRYWKYVNSLYENWHHRYEQYLMRSQSISFNGNIIPDDIDDDDDDDLIDESELERKYPYPQPSELTPKMSSSSLDDHRNNEFVSIKRVQFSDDFT
ncbi:hypothetical protein SNEBB_009745 [Seison nebaliae]|nr:hypothetical protein SNEBB_009745 [Seison nebaliae]